MLCKQNLRFASCATNKRIFACAMALMFALLVVPAYGQQHIHELYYNNSDWTDTDLTALTGGPNSFQGGIAAFSTTPNDQIHVYYLAYLPDAFHIYQLYNNGISWSEEDLTAATGGQSPVFFSSIAGFSIGGAQYVYFCGSDSVVHEYSYGNNGNFNWVDTALPTGGAGGKCYEVYHGLVAFATTPNNERHVYYEAGNGDSSAIHQLYFNGSTWSNQNLTSMIHGARANQGTWMSGFAIGNFQYVFFAAAGKGHIHEYSYINSWTDQDLTVAGGGVATQVLGNSGTAAFVVPGTTQMEVYYAAEENNDVHQMTFQSNQWTDTDLSTLTGMAGPNGSQIIGFATTPNNQLHVYLAPGNPFVDQLYYNGTAWLGEALPSSQPSDFGMAGFALGNSQRVYYIH
jgi:hypothetical protein